MRELTSISAETFFMELLNMALLATWIMLAVILFRAILKKWLPRRVVILGWLLVVFRLVCPFTIESVVSLIPSGKPIPMDIPYSQTPAIHVGVPIIDNPVNTLLSEHMAPTPEVSVNPLQIAFTVAFVIWLVGVAALLIYTILSYILLHRRVRLAVKLSANERLPHGVTLWQSEAVNSPFILGMFKPRIYLPYGMDDETLTPVLAHESAHLRRLDHITKLLAFLICAVYWFHPLVWVCYLLFCRDMEAACDERVVKDMDDTSRRAYAHALLSCASGQRMRPFCPPAFGETDVKSRIKGVLSYKKPLLWLIVAAILILAVLGVFLRLAVSYSRGGLYLPAVLCVSGAALRYAFYISSKKAGDGRGSVTLTEKLSIRDDISRRALISLALGLAWSLVRALSGRTFYDLFAGVFFTLALLVFMFLSARSLSRPMLSKRTLKQSLRLWSKPSLQQLKVLTL